MIVGSIKSKTTPTTAIFGINVSVTSCIDVVAWKIPIIRPTSIAEPNIGKHTVKAVLIVSLLKKMT
jgi:hypothetical protein